MIEYFDSKSKVWDQHQYRIERAKTVADSIKTKIPLNQAQTLLDFGCGTGLLGLNFLDSVTNIVLADNSVGMLDQVNQKIQSQSLNNVSTLLLENGELGKSFDVIVSLMVLHHIDNIEDQIAQLAASVKVGGYICLCDLDKEDGAFHQEEIVPHNGFDREYIEEILRRNRMKIQDTSTVYVNHKKSNDVDMEFPVFMIIGKKIA